MPWTAPSGTSYLFPWEDGASGGTALDASNLNQQQADEQAFILVVGNSLAAYIDSQVAGGSGGVASFDSRTGAVMPATGDYTVSQVTGAAPIASPTFTGTPLAPTATAGTSTTQLSTTAFVAAAIASLARLASPTFTGTPLAPTATSGTDTTQIATTAFVQSAVSSVSSGGVTSIASSATPAIDVDTTSEFEITALAANITSMTSGMTGTPADGQKLLVRIKDNGTARTITWGSKFLSSGVATLLATTVASKTHLSGFIYDSVKAAWLCMAVDATGY